MTGASALDLSLDELERVSTVALTPGITIERKLIEAVNLAGADASSVQLLEVALKSAELTEARLSAARLSDVLATWLVAPNARLRHVSMTRCAFDNSTFVGVDFGEGKFSQVTLTACKLDLANFRLAELENVVFDSCSLREVDFYGAKLRDVHFRGSDLEGADFNQATLARVDFRSSKVIGIRGVGSLKGGVIDAGQLVQPGARARDRDRHRRRERRWLLMRGGAWQIRAGCPIGQPGRCRGASPRPQRTASRNRSGRRAARPM